MQQSFSSRVISWHNQFGRKDLPWQQNKTPYRVYISEIMLQQTQVKTVIPYYLKFMQRFPTVASLAEASEDEVLHYWSGLGYYSRARNLHKAAQKITDDYAGIFPQQLEQVIELPGIGRSTAGAILSLSLGQQHTILDGNVKRVLGRYFAIEEWPGNKKVEDRMWRQATELTPANQIEIYNQAMMDIGATLCTRTKPDCAACPVNADCQGYASGQPTDFPGKKPKKQLPEKSCLMLVLQHRNQYRLEKRPPTGIWGGLWSFPEFDDLEALQLYLDKHNISQTFQQQDGFRHTFSHYHLDITPVVVQLNGESRGLVSETNTALWYNIEAEQNIGLSAATKKIIKQL